MGRYAGTAKNIVNRLAAIRQEKIEEEQSVRITAENIVGSLTEFTEDLKASLNAQLSDLDVDIGTSSWKRNAEEIVGSVFVGQNKNDVRVSIPFGGAGDIKVNGRPIPRDAVTGAISEEIFRLLIPYAERDKPDTSVIILVRRFVRADREDKFLEEYRAQTPATNPAFRGETLTRVSSSDRLPPELQRLKLNGSGCVTYLNVARWDSWEEFAKQFAKQLSDGGFDPEIETAPRERAVLAVVDARAKNKA